MMLSMQAMQHSLQQDIGQQNLLLEQRFKQLYQEQQNALHQGFREVNSLLANQQAQARSDVTQALASHTEKVAEQINLLNKNTENRLNQINQKVNDSLNQGFAKSIEAFNDVVKRLALIDQAQQKIAELSSNVVSLQSVLADKRSRGAFGEVQLYSLIENILSPSQYQHQAGLSNGKIVDCLLKLPEPTGQIAIDSKFPLESFQRMTDFDNSDVERKAAERQFKQDVKKHIKDIAQKYIIAGETADSAIMFLPAEAIFAEIHAHHSDLVELAWNQKIWLTSPTTLMAILTTAKAVLKDEATRAQVNIIQTHLIKLSEDFDRFGHRFDQLAKHIDQAANDVKQIHTSANKITGRFKSIESLQLESEQEVSQ
ncbi:DNA recombination protein RmuC [Marinifaba aquimaris]|uniref:DNA recombination protein RmuC n=1 Tax=Marinifaba aquimaris TaxID=2741323 RepID=UPI001FE7940F|nr:DNA recombination protein RmuC [Marinifaba aquimaris]